MKYIEQFMRNKVRIGAFCGFISGMLLTGIANHILPDIQLLQIAAFVLSYSSVGLLGSGAMKSDDYYKDRATVAGMTPSDKAAVVQLGAVVDGAIQQERVQQAADKAAGTGTGTDTGKP